MWLYLCGVRVPPDTHAFNEIPRYFKPIELRISAKMSIQISSSAIEFAQDCNPLNIFNLPLNYLYLALPLP